MSWSDSLDDLNDSLLDAFGIECAHTPASGPPYAFQAERKSRERIQNEALANYEQVWTRAGELQSPVLGGDSVAVAGQNYIVHSAKPDADPSSDGITIYLARAQS